MLVESEKREMGGDVACVAVALVPEGRQRCRYLAVRGAGCCAAAGLVLQRQQGLGKGPIVVPPPPVPQ